MAAPLHIKALRLQHFRNHTALSLQSDARYLLITGANGSGKTNILEAVSLLAGGRGLRRASALHMAQQTSQPQVEWLVSARLQRGELEHQLGIGWQQHPEGDKRQVRIDGTPAKSKDGLLAYVSLNWLTPQMHSLFLEGGSARRKLLDRYVYSFDHAHASRMHQYEQLVRERNRLLSLPRAEAAWFHALEQQMAALSVAIILARRQLLQRLQAASVALPEIFIRPTFMLHGQVEQLLDAHPSALDAEQALQAAYHATRGADVAVGRTQFGAHRSEFYVYFPHGQEAAQCSTGEQKALLLSLVLAHAHALQRWSGIAPILLLDEGGVHLDAQRRAAFFSELIQLGSQCWFTDTDATAFADFPAELMHIPLS